MQSSAVHRNEKGHPSISPPISSLPERLSRLRTTVKTVALPMLGSFHNLHPTVPQTLLKPSISRSSQPVPVNMSRFSTSDGFMASGQRRSNKGGPLENEPGAKRQKNQTTIANVATFNNRRVTTGKLQKCQHDI
jgi:hypothetical protein